jgi:hypothetical protein
MSRRAPMAGAHRLGAKLLRWEDWAGTCRELVLTRTDGMQHRAFFQFVEPE